MSKSTEANLQHINLLTGELYEAQQRLNNFLESGHKTGKQEEPGWKVQAEGLKDTVKELQEKINRAHSDLSTGG